MKRFILLLVGIVMFNILSAQNKYGKYIEIDNIIGNREYEVTDKFLNAVNRYNPAVAKALRRGVDVSYDRDRDYLDGTEFEDWSWLLSAKDYEKFNSSPRLFENAAISQARQHISNLQQFWAYKYVERKELKILDLTNDLFLDYIVIDNLENIIRLSSSSVNNEIKYRIKKYLYWGSGAEIFDIIKVYKTFKDKSDAESYTNSIRHIIDTNDFQQRLETGKLTKNDLAILGSYGIFIKENVIPQITINNGEKRYQSSGSGFVLSPNGIIVTNYHVVEDANGIDVLISRNGEVKTYKAKILISDKTNDISLLKIDDTTFTKLATLPYAINTRVLDVGTKVFALGYPMSNILGEEIKLTDGLISSKTGFQGDIVTYQISAPIQPGNSGGPLFDQNGNIVGITNAGVPDAQNVGYAIKTSYLRNLIDVAPESISLPAQNNISGLSFTEKIKRLTPYVVLIKVY